MAFLCSCFLSASHVFFPLFCSSSSAAVPLRGDAGGPWAFAGAGALRDPLQFHQRCQPQEVRRHGVGHGRGGGQHQPGSAAGRTLGQHGPRVLHRYVAVPIIPMNRENTNQLLFRTKTNHVFLLDPSECHFCSFF